MPDQNANPEPTKGIYTDDPMLQQQIDEIEAIIGDAARAEILRRKLEFAKEATDCTEPILRFFTFTHLPDHLQEVSRGFYELAKHIVSTLPRCAERTVALRKLLEGKDAAVRAAL